MAELFYTIWQIVPAPYRPFIWPAVVMGILGYLYRDKRSKLEHEADAWDAHALTAVRADNDRMTGRMRELEESYPTLRSSYDDIISRMRAAHGEELRLLADDRNRGWDLARGWCDYAHTLRHWINNKLMLIPEDRRPLDVPGVPPFERVATKPAEAFPDRYVVDPGSRPPRPA